MGNVDISFTLDGEIILTNGDLTLISNDTQITQEINFRLRTTKGDWTLSPNVGASLEDFIGQPNTPATHTLIEQRVQDALSYGNLLTNADISAFDIGENEVFILIEFPSTETSDKIISLQSSLSLMTGQLAFKALSRTY